jgi:membrane protein CcdC involved in cytochrome C biogenesis
VNLQELYLRFEPMLRPALRIGPLFGGAALIFWRVRETRVPVTERAILIPPFAMSTGFGIFVLPLARVPWSWGIGTFLIGLGVLAWPLVNSSKLELRDGVVYLKRSRAFLWILLGLLALRIALHEEIGHLISPLQTAGLFFLLAFGMIVHWRAAMFRDYRRIIASP